MRALRGVIVLVLAIALPAPVLAADFQDGWKAYARGDYAAAMKEWRPLAEQGDADAQYYLGRMYDRRKGVPQDYTEAARWYRLAAKQGDAVAQFSLGVMYEKGSGIPQDYTEAAKWYRLAAEQGHAYGQATVASMYAKGMGVIQNYVLAHMWFDLAAVRFPPGEERELAVGNRDKIEKRMRLEQVAEAQRLARDWKPK
jgi:TPR repeat protein